MCPNRAQGVWQMIRLGNYIINEDVIVAMRPSDDGDATMIQLKYSAEIQVNVPFEEIVGCLVAAGILPDAVSVDLIQVSGADALTLARLHRDGFRYLARDFDGKLFAYKSAPYKRTLEWHPAGDDEGVPRRVKEGFSVVTWDDDQPLNITVILQDLNR